MPDSSGASDPLRRWLAWRLLDLVRIIYPSAKPKAKVWQIIEVPRRISEAEAQQLSEMVKNL